ncbi:MAG: hypothetical protein A3H94_07685 [Acidobacteria bacterium RIFCSPLOWO2_02_FULL_60_20]|nr:MAG: hypothetical protein A3H94_07685 [Acidobacteria bacterium RIFCSPLOWO2_02_FULL_60_20]
MFGFLLLRTVAAQDIRLPFGAGEKLSYTVHWRLLPAGIAELVVSPDRSAPGRWKATAKAHSVGYVSNIYRVEDEYQSQFRNPGFCSSGIHKQIQEGNRHRDVKLEFDPRRRLARLEDRDMLDHTPPKIEQFAIPECVQDILSAVYYARSLPMTVGQSFEFPLNDGAKTIQIHVEVQAEEEVTTEVGKFQAIRVEPDVFSGHLFSGKGRMFIWFTKDARRIPVQLRAQISVGTITATLSEIGREE